MSEPEDKNSRMPNGKKGGSTAPYGGAALGPGAQIGPYKLLSVLGEGGFAVVYSAEQERPVKRRVALKVIKPGMDSKQVIARFEAERQALALLDHPSIAHVFDAGTTELGRPYFVMEYVRGVPITEHCDKEKLSIAERLGLFEQVCEGIQHAHQKGIIHRDIKPSNTLVSIEGEKAVPKIIDFGVAKAITQPLTERTLYTEQGQFVGTPEYMSPEQAEMGAQDVDTRSDVYSLGVLLYELLTGALPFDAKTLREGGVDHIRQIIREQDPKTPSTRLTSLGEEAKKVAERRRTEVSTLARRLHKELEWIPLKAMRKERARRYRSASELADDVRNYLDGAPLIAGPESTMYRFRKSLLRNRALVTGLAAVLSVVIAGVVVSTVFAVRAKRQATISQAVADFLTDDLLGYVAPEKAKSPEVTVHSVLDAASKSLEGRFEGKPLIEASIRQKLGETYRKLGDYKAAEPHLERTYQIRADLLGRGDISTLTAMNDLGSLYLDQARFDDAEPLLVEAWQKRRRLLGQQHPDTLASAVQVALLSLLHGSSAVSDVEGLFAETLDTARRALGDEHLVTLDAMLGLSTAYMTSGRNQEAESLYVEGLETAERVLGAEHEITLWFMNMLALSRCDQGRFEQSAPLITRAFEISRRLLGTEHPVTIQSMFMRGLIYRFLEQDDERAESLMEESVQLSRRILGDEHFWTLLYMHSLSNLYRDQGRYEDEEHLLAKVVEGRVRLLGGKSPFTQVSIRDLCLLYEISGQFDKLKTLFLSKSRMFEKQRTEPDESDAALAGYLNEHAWRRATYPVAELRNGPEAVENATKACELTNWKVAAYVDTLAAAYAEAGDFASAIDWQKKAIDLMTEQQRARQQLDFESRLKRYESEQPARQSLVRGVAWDTYCQGLYTEAERGLIKALECCRRVFGEEHSETLACLGDFVQLYEAWGKPEEAEKWRTKLIERDGKAKPN